MSYNVAWELSLGELAARYKAVQTEIESKKPNNFPVLGQVVNDIITDLKAGNFGEAYGSQAFGDSGDRMVYREPAKIRYSVDPNKKTVRLKSLQFHKEPNWI